MEYNYKGLRDKHLNVFCGYDKDYLENNITKAFINVLDSLEEENQRRMFQELFGIELPLGEMKAEFYLQRSPNKHRFEHLDEAHRVLFAFSPSGKICEAIEGIAENDEKAIYEAVKKDVEANRPDLEKEEQKKLIADRINDLGMKHNHDSVPDGWVLISLDGKIEYVVAMENKRYDLNPFQLRNHLKNGLNCSEAHPVIFATFASIVEKLDSCKTFLTGQFHEYLIILGYLAYKPSFVELAGLDRSLIKRYFADAATPIVEAITGVIRKEEEKKEPRKCRWTKRHGFQGARVSCTPQYLREINLCYQNEEDKHRFYLSMALGPTQNSAKELYQTLTLDDMKALCENAHAKVFGPWCTIHCLYQRGRNTAYLDKDAPDNFEAYFSFWQRHAESIQLYTKPSDCGQMYMTMAEEGVIKQRAAEWIYDYFKNKKNPVSIVPEIVFELSWPMEEIAEMKDNAQVIERMIAALKEFFLKAKLLDPGEDWPY